MNIQGKKLKQEILVIFGKLGEENFPQLKSLLSDINKDIEFYEDLFGKMQINQEREVLSVEEYYLNLREQCEQLKFVITSSEKHLESLKNLLNLK